MIRELVLRTSKAAYQITPHFRCKIRFCGISVVDSSFDLILCIKIPFSKLLFGEAREIWFRNVIERRKANEIRHYFTAFFEINDSSFCWRKNFVQQTRKEIHDPKFGWVTPSCSNCVSENRWDVSPNLSNSNHFRISYTRLSWNVLPKHKIWFNTYGL